MDVQPGMIETFVNFFSSSFFKAPWICGRSSCDFFRSWSIEEVLVLLRASSSYALPGSTNCFLLWLNFLPGRENLLYLMIDEKQHLFMMPDEDTSSCLGKLSLFQLRWWYFQNESRNDNRAMNFCDSIKFAVEKFSNSILFPFSVPK